MGTEARRLYTGAGYADQFNLLTHAYANLMEYQLIGMIPRKQAVDALGKNKLKRDWIRGYLVKHDDARTLSVQDYIRKYGGHEICEGEEQCLEALDFSETFKFFARSGFNGFGRSGNSVEKRSSKRKIPAQKELCEETLRRRA